MFHICFLTAFGSYSNNLYGQICKIKANMFVADCQWRLYPQSHETLGCICAFICVCSTMNRWTPLPHKHTKPFNVEEIESPKFEELWGGWKFFATNETKTRKKVDQNVLAAKRYLSFFLMIKSTLLFSTIYFISKSYFSTKIWLEFFQFFLLLSMTSFWCFYCFKFEYILHLFLVLLLLTLNK